MSLRGVLGYLWLLDETASLATFFVSAGIDRPLFGARLFVACLDAPVFTIDYRTSINPTGIGGRSIPSVGAITLHNDDGSLDFLANRIFSGRRLEIYFGPPNNEEFFNYSPGMSPDLVALFDDNVSWNEQQFTVPIRDAGVLFDTPVQRLTYAGTGHLEGQEALKENVKPVAFGQPRNVPPVQVDSTEGNFIYQCHDRSFEITEIYDRGIPYGSDNFDYVSDLYLWTPVGGRVAILEGYGMFRLGSQATGLVTCDFRTTDVTGIVTSRTNTHVAFATYMLDRAGLIGPGQNQVTLDVEGLAALDNEIDGRISFFSSQKTSIAAVLDQIAISFGGFWTVDRMGRFTMKRLLLPRSIGWTAPTVVIKAERVVSIERTEADPPAWEVKINYDRNFRPMAEADFGGSSASENFREDVKLEWKTDVDTYGHRQPITKEHYPPGRSVTIDTLFKDGPDDNFFLSLYLEYAGYDTPIPRDRYVVGVRGIFGRVNLGDIVELQYPRFGLNQGITQLGKLFLVLGVKEEPDIDTTEDLTTLTLWGGLAAPLGYEP